MCRPRYARSALGCRGRRRPIRGARSPFPDHCEKFTDTVGFARTDLPGDHSAGRRLDVHFDLVRGDLIKRVTLGNVVTVRYVELDQFRFGDRITRFGHPHLDHTILLTVSTSCAASGRQAASSVAARGTGVYVPATR